MINCKFYIKVDIIGKGRIVIIAKIKNANDSNYDSAASYIGAATRALTEADAEPARVKIYHNGTIYLDLPLTKGRLVCPVQVNTGLWQVEIWGNYKEECNKCLLTSEPILKK